MPTNIEIKARVNDGEQLQRIAAALSEARWKSSINSIRFSHAPQGRLKLRYFSPTRGELIVYEREDVAGSKASRYLITCDGRAGPIAGSLNARAGGDRDGAQAAHLYLVGQTRIHLDEVDDLGPFLELEVVLFAGSANGGGAKRSRRDLMEKLGVKRAT